MKKSYVVVALILFVGFFLGSCQMATDMVLGKGSYQLMQDTRQFGAFKTKYRNQVKPVYQAYILKKYSNKLLRPQDVGLIDLSDVEIGYSYELFNLVDSTVQKFIIVSNNGGVIRLNHSIRNKNKTEDLKTYTMINRSGTALEKENMASVTPVFPIYSPHKCSFVLGECTFTRSTNYKKQTATRDYKVNTTFKNGVWYSTLEVKGKTGFTKVYDAEAMYDPNGFPLFIYQDKFVLPYLLVRNDSEMEAKIAKYQSEITSGKVNGSSAGGDKRK